MRFSSANAVGLNSSLNPLTRLGHKSKRLRAYGMHVTSHPINLQNEN